MVDVYKEINSLWIALNAKQKREVMEIEHSIPFSADAVLYTYYKCSFDSKETRSYLKRVLSKGD